MGTGEDQVLRHPPTPTVPFLPLLQANRRACGTLGAVPSRVRYRLGGLALTVLGLVRLAFPMDPSLKVLRNPCHYLARTCTIAGLLVLKAEGMTGYGHGALSSLKQT